MLTFTKGYWAVVAAAAAMSLGVCSAVLDAEDQSAGALPTQSNGAAADTPAPADAGAGLADLSSIELGEPFRSRSAGIELRPPAGGTVVRQANGDDIARMLYPERGWDIHLKVTRSSKPVPLSSPPSPDVPAGLLELTVDQITGADPTAQVLEQGVKKFPPNDAAIIVVRHHRGTDLELLQEAIFQRSKTEFYKIEFTTQLDSAAGAADAPAVAASNTAKEQSARQVFALMLGTVRLLDLSELTREQQERLLNTEALYSSLHENRIRAAMVPRQVMRVVRDGRDVGFIVQTEQLATHSDHDGIEIDLRSHVEAEAAKADRAAPAVPGGQVIDLPKSAGGVVAGAPMTPAAAPQPVRVDRISKLFVTFDRRHEDWSVQTRVDSGQRIPAVTTELGNSDQEVHEELDRAALAEHAVVDQRDPKQPPVRTREKYTLSVSFYTPSGSGVPLERQLPPYYLPQALAPLLPSLVSVDGPSRYMFYSYVSEERQVMARYIDVQGEREVTLDGKPMRAVSVQDRIGIDGFPTIAYVSRDGQWLGSVSPEQKLMVLPSDAATIDALWHGANAESDNMGASPSKP